MNNKRRFQPRTESRAEPPNSCILPHRGVAEQVGQQEAGEAQEKDYKALYEEAVKESRKWEKRSKDNLAQLNGLRESQGKPDPTIEERIAALEKENSDLKAASARAALVDSVAKATGLDRAIVATLSGADEDALTEQAQ